MYFLRKQPIFAPKTGAFHYLRREKTLPQNSIIEEGAFRIKKPYNFFAGIELYIHWRLRSRRADMATC